MSIASDGPPGLLLQVVGRVKLMAFDVKGLRRVRVYFDTPLLLTVVGLAVHKR